VLGAAEKAIVGVGAVTDTVAVCDADPLGPVQVNVKLSLPVRAPVPCEPLTAFVPDHAPDAVHVVALVADQFRVELPPLLIALGPTLRLTDGAAVDAATVTVVDCVAVPPEPLHFSV
jgi:hypothetical protein